MGDLSWGQKKVGVMFGVIRDILTLTKQFNSNEFVFAWDSRSSKREKIFPEYKFQRRKEKTPEEEELDAIAYKQFDILRTDLIPLMGFKNSFVQDGFEADDIIASLIFSNNPRETIHIISTDEDLYQLLSDNVDMYSMKKKQFFTNISLWKEFRILPKNWIEVKAIAGCKTDGIPGVPGVGEKTACKYINHRLNPHYKTYQDIENNEKLIERNRRLVRLPFEGTPHFLTSPDDLSLGNFIDICEEYGFRSFLERENLNKWKELVFYADHKGKERKMVSHL
jgi:DNA polymerase-1